MDEQGRTDDQGEVHQRGRFHGDNLLERPEFRTQVVRPKRGVASLGPQAFRASRPRVSVTRKGPFFLRGRAFSASLACEAGWFGWQIRFAHAGFWQVGEYHSVLETSTHGVGLHGSGEFHLYLKDGK